MFADAAQPLALWVDLFVDLFTVIVGVAVLVWLWRHRRPGFYNAEPRTDTDIMVERFKAAQRRDDGRFQYLPPTFNPNEPFPRYVRHDRYDDDDE